MVIGLLTLLLSIFCTSLTPAALLELNWLMAHACPVHWPVMPLFVLTTSKTRSAYQRLKGCGESVRMQIQILPLLLASWLDPTKFHKKHMVGSFETQARYRGRRCNCCSRVHLEYGQCLQCRVRVSYAEHHPSHLRLAVCCRYWQTPDEVVLDRRAECVLCQNDQLPLGRTHRQYCPPFWFGSSRFLYVQQASVFMASSVGQQVTPTTRTSN